MPSLTHGAARAFGCTNGNSAAGASGTTKGRLHFMALVTARETTMKDMLAHLEMLQSQIAECERLQGAFARLAAHYTGLARELEAAIVAVSQPIPHASHFPDGMKDKGKAASVGLISCTTGRFTGPSFSVKN